MKPVYQAIIDNERGDCERACVATILGCPIEDVPNFSDPDLPVSLWMREWVGTRGWGLIETKRPTTPRGVTWAGLLGLVAIATVPSQMFPECKHAVVVGWREHPDYSGALGCYVVHDPNPGNEPYQNVEDIVERLRWLVPQAGAIDRLTRERDEARAEATSWEEAANRQADQVDARIVEVVALEQELADETATHRRTEAGLIAGLEGARREVAGLQAQNAALLDGIIPRIERARTLAALELLQDERDGARAETERHRVLVHCAFLEGHTAGQGTSGQHAAWAGSMIRRGLDALPLLDESPDEEGSDDD